MIKSLLNWILVIASDGGVSPFFNDSTSRFVLKKTDKSAMLTAITQSEVKTLIIRKNTLLTIQSIALLLNPFNSVIVRKNCVYKQS